MVELTKPLVLIVDDMSENLDFLRSILEKDYRVKAAKNGIVALSIAARYKPDLILLDVIMPEMDGYEVCQWLKSDQETADIPVIFVTTRDHETEEALGFSLGAVDYITKPVSPMCLLSRVKAHIGLMDRQHILEEMVRKQTDLLTMQLRYTLDKLGQASEYKDEETGRHITRIGRYSYETAKELGFTNREAENLRFAAPLHDVGKIGIPDCVLLKPDRLDADEWEIMKTHTTIGRSILDGNDQPLIELAGNIALMHHERWDGKGYPSGLKCQSIDINARIVSVVDVFDALTSKRPYKNAWEYQKAINLIADGAGGQFDPEVVEAFLSCQDRIREIMLVTET